MREREIIDYCVRVHFFPFFFFVFTYVHGTGIPITAARISEDGITEEEKESVEEETRRSRSCRSEIA